MTNKHETLRVAIVDHGLGNLFSVKHACEHAGLIGAITNDRREIVAADAVILPGVGAFGDAMDTLHRLDLVSLLRDIAASDKPFMGICLGVQLLMSEGQEFGNHEGLGIIRGTVVRLDHSEERGRRSKVPEVGWNTIHRISQAGTPPADPWKGTLLEGVPEGEFMYFVHSYVVKPEEEVVLSTTRYCGIEFCSSVRRNNVFACQFHPERSGPAGLRIYENFTGLLKEKKNRSED